jgi:hypothetical protein
MTDETTKARQRLNQRRYRDHKREDRRLIVGAAGFAVDKIVEILKTMIQAANSNPLMGMIAAVIMADILARTKIIDNGTAAGIWAIVGTVEGASIAGTVISDFTDIFKIFSKSPTQDLMRPSASTIVYGQGNDKDKAVDLQALMNQENKQ